MSDIGEPTIKIGVLLSLALLGACSVITGEVGNPVVKEEAIPSEYISPLLSEVILEHHIKWNQCSKPTICGDVIKLACRPEVDGVVYYLSNTSGELIMKCGGACMFIDEGDSKDCKRCPPMEWQCDNNR